jgi:energy-coupling factor transporter ATP-binding protein EcfA2
MLISSTAATPWPKRLQEFQAFTVAHPYLVAAKDELLQAIQQSEANSIVMVFGPTGVGKTTLRMRAEQVLTEELRGEMESSPWRLPVASIEAAAPEAGTFNWSSHFRKMLQEIGDPFTPQRRLLGPVNVITDEGDRVALTPRSSGSEYRCAFEQALRYRRPAAVMIDEAQHLAKVASGRRLLDQLDVIKSIANRTNTIHVLFGTYDLLAFRNLSGQLSRRSVDVHFPRYRAESPEERKMFINVVHSFQQRLPLAEPPDLVKHWELLYERSFGCVGILKQWLVQTVAAALRRGDSGISIAGLERHALSVTQCDRILSEIVEGEARMAESNASRANLRVRLGLAAPESPSKRNAAVRPGMRRPSRDPVGQAVHATV